MANTQGPFGFRPALRSDSAMPNFAAKQYLLAYNNANTIARGDPVKLLASGFVDVLAPGTTAMLGIFAGVSYPDPNLQRTSWYNAWRAPTLTSGTVVICWVWDDPNIIFEGQVGGSSSTGVVQADVGANIQFAGQSAPNTGGYSVAYVDQTSIATTATLPFRIWDLGNRIGNDNLAAYNTVLLKPNFSQMNNTTGV